MPNSSKCRTTHCHRKPVFDVHGFRIFDDEEPTPMCLPCYVALTEGFRRHRVSVSREIRSEDITEKDLEKIRDIT